MFTGLSRRAVLASAAALAAPRPTAAQGGERTLLVVSPWEYTSDDPVDTGYIHTRLGVAETLIGVQPDGRLVGQIAEAWPGVSASAPACASTTAHRSPPLPSHAA